MALHQEKPSELQLEVKPWFNSDEFHEVAAAIFSDDIEAKKWGLDKIEIWKFRNYSSPIIDATAALVRARFQDDLDTTGTFYCDEHGLQLLYIQGIIRFVNVMKESVLNETSPVPASSAAKKLGFPSWIVNLRHAATHSSIPPLVELRNAGTVALNFLRQSYWDPVVPEVEISNNPPVSLEAKLLALVKSYILKKCADLTVSPDISIRSKAHSCTEEILKMTALFQKDSTQFFNILLRPGVFFFLPSNLNRIEFDCFSDVDGTLPNFIFKTWAPLIRRFNMANKMQLFVEHLIDCQKSLSLFYQKMACAWILKLINTVINDGQTHGKNDPIAKIYRAQNWVFDWYTLSVRCVLKASKCMPAILPVIWQQVYPPLRPEVVSKLAMMIALYLGSLPSEAKDALLPKLKPSDSAEDITEQEHNAQPINPWNRSTNDINWSKLPLGFVFDSQSHFIKASFNDEAKEEEAMEIESASNASKTESEKKDSASESSKPVPVNITVRTAAPSTFTRDGFY